jgi:hypothetical protein
MAASLLLKLIPSEEFSQGLTAKLCNCAKTLMTAVHRAARGDASGVGGSRIRASRRYTNVSRESSIR